MPDSGGQHRLHLNTNISNSVGRGYATPGMYVKNADNTVLKAFGGYLYTWWDFNLPVMDEFSYQPDTRKFIMRVTDNDRLDNSQIGMWDARSFVVKATNSQNQVITVPMIPSRDDTYKEQVRRVQRGKPRPMVTTPSPGLPRTLMVMQPQ